MDNIELLAYHVAQQQQRPLICNLPASETFNSCAYNSSLNNTIAINHSLFSIPPISEPLLQQSSNLVSFPSLPTSLQLWEDSLKEACNFGASEEMKELRVISVADPGGGPVCDPLIAKQKKASILKDSSQAESLRRRKMSKWFSKLEILLPQDDIPKFDRCSLIDAAISYILSLQKTISEASQQKKARASGDTVEGIVKRQKVESCEGVDSASTTAAVAAATTKTSVINTASWPDEEGVISISVSDPEHAFINAITSHTDPVLFSTMLSVLHQHHLHVLNANFTRNADKVVFSFYAKIPSEMGDYNHQCLKDHLSSVLTSLHKA